MSQVAAADGCDRMILTCNDYFLFRMEKSGFTLSCRSMDTNPHQLACSKLLPFISCYKEMEAHKQFSIAGLSKVIVHFHLELKMERNIIQFKGYVAFTPTPSSLKMLLGG